jgi:subtilisin family serine protease
MNKKYFLRGLGLGLIISAIVMMVAIKTGTFNIESTSDNDGGSNSASSTVDGVTTEGATAVITEEVTEEATEAVTEEETEEVTEAITEEETETPTEATTEAVTEEITEEETEAPTEEETEAPTEEETEATTEEVKGGSITINYGNTAQTVASKLHDIGVIEDEEDFYMYMYNNGYASKILQGTFEFTGDESYEDIARILTH